MKRTRWKDRIRYQIDSVMSKGTASLILLLGLITLVVILVTGLAVIVIEHTWANNSWPYAVWKSFALTLDPGSLGAVEGSIGLIMIASVSALSGLFITSSLIGIINSGFSNRLDNLRRGNARIVEDGHTVILAFDESVFAIIEELQTANLNKKHACIVLLGDEDKQVMEEQIMRRIPKSNTTRVICRNGDLTSAHDLRRCSIETSKSVIINLMDDCQVIRTMLAVTNYLNEEPTDQTPDRRKSIHIAASINQPENLPVALIAGQGYAEVLHFNLILSRIMAHTCYQPGLSAVYLDLFDFKGDEIYIESFPQLAGLTFHDAQLSFDKSTVIGLKRGRELLINPDPAITLQEEDEVILIAADDFSSVPKEKVPIIQSEANPAISRYHLASAGSLLILGSSVLLMDILHELNEFLPADSSVTISSKYKDALDKVQDASTKLSNLDLHCLEMDITSRSSIDGLLQKGFEHILILSDSHLSNEEADAKTLTILLQIRDWEKTADRQVSITTEMLSVRNQELAQVANVSDFVISSNITGLIMSQVSENRLLAPIFTELLDSAGSEIYMKPAAHYVEPGQLIDLMTLTHVVSLHREVLLGYKKTISGADGKVSSGIKINPDKNSKVAFSPQDWLIVLAED